MRSRSFLVNTFPVSGNSPRSPRGRITVTIEGVAFVVRPLAGRLSVNGKPASVFVDVPCRTIDIPTGRAGFEEGAQILRTFARAMSEARAELRKGAGHA